MHPERVNSLLIEEKCDGSIQVSLDPRDLNIAIKREHHKITALDNIISKLSGKSIFTVIDMKDDFYKVALDKPSRL